MSGEHIQQRRERRGGGQLERGGIDDLDAGDRLGLAVGVLLGALDCGKLAAAVAAAGVRVDAQLKRKGYVVGGEIAAIVPLDAFVQVERPCQVVIRDRPAVGQVADDLAVGDIVGDQVAVDLIEKVIVAAGAQRIKVVDANAAGANPCASQCAAGRALFRRSVRCGRGGRRGRAGRRGSSGGLGCAGRRGG